MTPRQIANNRYWTPRIALATFALNIGGVALWWFISTWMTDIKTEVISIHSEMKAESLASTERRIANSIWKQNMADKTDAMDVRLVRVENKVGI